MILKFFLNVSKKAQKERFLERLEKSEKNWKFSLADAQERNHWKAYMNAYQDGIRATASKEAPWYVVPADKKWFARLVVAGAIYDALAKLGLRYPEVGPEKKKELAAARAELLGETKTNGARSRTRARSAERPRPSPEREAAPAPQPSAPSTEEAGQ